MRMWPFVYEMTETRNLKLKKLSLSPPRRTHCRFHVKSIFHNWPVVRIPSSLTDDQLCPDHCSISHIYLVSSKFLSVLYAGQSLIFQSYYTANKRLNSRISFMHLKECFTDLTMILKDSKTSILPRKLQEQPNDERESANRV